MLPLELRQEFRSAHMRGTLIELCNKQNTGWAQREAAQILRITYPTADVQRALEAVSKASSGRPVLLKGARGRGKSHIMALLHHAFKVPEKVDAWAKDWAPRLAAQGIESRRLGSLALQRGLLPLTESLSDQEYPHLWDVLFHLHPKGLYYKGRFEQSRQQTGQAVPPKSLIRDLLVEQPTALILDELQTWFDGLHDTPGDEGPKRRQWAFNFIQTLSELATERPDLLALIASVRDSSTEAHQQIWRVGPLLVDFKGETAKEDRKRLVLYRLFENRDKFAAADVARVVAGYAEARNQLFFNDRSEADKENLRREVVECWPFAPELLNLLDDQILMATAAQDTRDLIRILAEVFRSRGGKGPLVTVADFHVDDDDCGVTTLVDSFAATADQERLRQTTLRNLQAVRDTKQVLPNARGLISAIWMRSLGTANAAGASAAELQLDVTRDAPLDANLFKEELETILEHSFNIHEVPSTEGKRFCFRLEENPLAKVKASAKNDKLFEPTTAAPPGLVAVRKDQQFLLRTLNSLLNPPDSVTEPPSRPIVLDPNWETAPWANVPQQDHPQAWTKPVLLVLPVSLPRDRIAETLGPWLAEHVTFNRNLVRFLLQKPGLPRLHDDKDLLTTARRTLLAKEWKEGDPRYSELHKRFKRELEKELSARFDAYALLSRWNYQQPKACVFHVEAHSSSGGAIPAAVEKHIRENLFAREDFEVFVVACAGRNETMRQLLALLRDPPTASEKDVVPYLGDNALYEQVLRIAARDRVALNVNGTWHRREAGQGEEDALQMFRQRAYRTGKELHDVQLGVPGLVGSPGIIAPPPAEPVKPSVVGPVPKGNGQVIGTSFASNEIESFDDGYHPVQLVAAPVIRQSLGAQTGVNLLGELEKWAYPNGQKVSQAQLTLAGITIKELRELCSKLPPKLRAELRIVLPDEGGD